MVDLDEKNSKEDMIINAALKLFSERGYHKTAVSEIAQEAGVAKGTVYWYFDSKKQLFQAILLSGLKELQARIRNKIKEEQDEIKKLRIIVELYLNFFEEGSQLSKMYQESTIAISKDFKEKMITFREREANLITNIINTAQSKGDFKAEINSSDAANLVLGMISSYNPHICEEVDGALTDKVEVIINLFFNGIRT
jgi:AcrR family transcriptional regulator